MQLEQPENTGTGNTGQRGQEAGSDALTAKFAVHGVPSQIQETAACDREQRVQNMRAKIRREAQLQRGSGQRRRLGEQAPAERGPARFHGGPDDDAERHAFRNLVDGDGQHERRP